MFVRPYDLTNFILPFEVFAYASRRQVEPFGNDRLSTVSGHTRVTCPQLGEFGVNACLLGVPDVCIDSARLGGGGSHRGARLGDRLGCVDQSGQRLEALRAKVLWDSGSLQLRQGLARLVDLNMQRLLLAHQRSTPANFSSCLSTTGKRSSIAVLSASCTAAFANALGTEGPKSSLIGRPL